MKIKISNNSVYFKINNKELNLLIKEKIIYEKLYLNKIDTIIYCIKIINTKYINFKIHKNKTILSVSIYDLIKLNKYKTKNGIKINSKFINIYIQIDIKEKIKII